MTRVAFQAGDYVSSADLFALGLGLVLGVEIGETLPVGGTAVGAPLRGPALVVDEPGGRVGLAALGADMGGLGAHGSARAESISFLAASMTAARAAATASAGVSAAAPNWPLDAKNMRSPEGYTLHSPALAS